MENHNWLKMKNLDRLEKNQGAHVKYKGSIGKSSAEVQTSRVTLHYDNFEKKIDGLVTKRFRYSDAHEGEGSHFEKVMTQWKTIKEKMKERSKKGLPVFNLPGTIRSYKDKHGGGVLMTDLTRGGKIEICDLKDLSSNFSKLNLNLNDWENIKNQVLRDIEIANKENIKLGSGGRTSFDPWLIAIEDDGPKVYVIDIGIFTSIDPHPKTRESVHDHAKEEIENLNREIQQMFAKAEN